MRFFIIPIVVLVASLAGCTPKQDVNTSEQSPEATNEQAIETRNAIEVLKSQDQFSEFVKLLESVGLNELLIGPDQYTVFAPTNEAFAAVQQTIQSLADNPQELNDILTNHILSGKLMISDIKVLESAQTLSQDSIEISQVEDTTTISGAKVGQADIQSSNGVIHSIEAVILSNDSEQL